VFETIPAMTTPSLTILLKFPLASGASHHDKATSGSLVVQGCGFRYWGTPHHASQHRTSRSLHEGADPHGGILTLGGHNANIIFFFSASASDVLVIILSFLCFKARRPLLPPQQRRATHPQMAQHMLTGVRVKPSAHLVELQKNREGTEKKKRENLERARGDTSNK